MVFRRLLTYLQSLEKFGINLGLDRINYLLEQLGSPHHHFKSIHIAGTNGKGSTCAMIASILREGGYKVGLYTSPHLFDYTERIKINNKNISKKDFAYGLKIVERISRKPRRSVAGFRAQPTVFEVLTAVAFWYFAKKKVDYAVVEVGMGGRLDATNVITPLVSVITNIDYEHTAVLGKTLAKIAKEKAAIIKPKIPVVTAEAKVEPLRVIERGCSEKECRLMCIEPEKDWKPRSLPACRQARFAGFRLQGHYQRINAACAISAVRLAAIKVSRRAIARGLARVKWPGRFQIISKRPLIIVDGAHNPAGAQTLRDTIRELYPGQKFTLIFGAQEDKDYRKMLKVLAPICKRIILTQSSHKLAATPGKLVVSRRIPQLISLDSREAFRRARGDERILITGSLFLVADALKFLAV